MIRENILIKICRSDTGNTRRKRA